MSTQLPIQRAATAFCLALGADPPAMTFVPVPPSNARADPLHDHRVARMLRALWRGQTADVRDIIVQPESADAVHESPA